MGQPSGNEDGPCCTNGRAIESLRCARLARSVDGQIDTLYIRPVLKTNGCNNISSNGATKALSYSRSPQGTPTIIKFP
eukprot:4508664-Amphidinium_carterae.1